MSSNENPWQDMHQRLYFLPKKNGIEVDNKGIIKPINIHWYTSSLATHEIYAKGDMYNISKTIPINISRKPSVIENVLIGAHCSLEEIKIDTTLLK